MIGPSRLNVGDLVRDHIGQHYIVVEILEYDEHRPLSYGAPWRYVVWAPGKWSHGVEIGRRQFKENGLVLVRKK